MSTYSDKFIGFVDVLGFKNLVTESEIGSGMPLPELLELLKKLGTGKERMRFDQSGPKWCPMAPRIENNLDFRVTQISDCVIVSAEVSPAGVINLLSHCWGAVIELMTRGIMCRGYIKRGLIFHSDTQVIGSGYQDAYLAEGKVSAFKREAEERGTPYVEVDPEVTNYIDTQSDPCVKDIFSRLTKRDGDTVVLFPFRRISHSFIVAGLGSKFHAESELAANDIVRRNIQRYKEKVQSFVDLSNKRAVTKASHYLHALDDQLRTCDETDLLIRNLLSPFGRKPA